MFFIRTIDINTARYYYLSCTKMHSNWIYRSSINNNSYRTWNIKKLFLFYRRMKTRKKSGKKVTLLNSNENVLQLYYNFSCNWVLRLRWLSFIFQKIVHHCRTCAWAHPSERYSTSSQDNTTRNHTKRKQRKHEKPDIEMDE